MRALCGGHTVNPSHTVTPHARPARSTQTYDACAVQQRARTHVAPQPSFIRRRPPLASPPSGLAPQLGAPPCTARTPGYRAATGRAGTLLLAARAQYESPVLQLRSRTCVLSDRARAPYLAGRRSRCRKVFRVYATQPVRPLYTPPYSKVSSLKFEIGVLKFAGDFGLGFQSMK